MKHIFVINPSAGKVDSTLEISKKVKALPDKIDHEIYITKAPGDATKFIQNWCRQHPDEPVRFYACGGDGTINEVASGVVGFPQAQMTCYPSGSGNDYIKYYGTREDFLDISRLVDGTPHPVDIMKVDGPSFGTRYSINVCNFGFDAMVAKTMNSVKRKPFIGGSRAYTTGIVKAVFTSRRNLCHVTIDNSDFITKKFLLCTLSNGQYVGGAFRCAPQSKNDDGLIEACSFSPISLLRFVSLLPTYTKGEHINSPKCQRFMTLRQGRVVEINTHKPFDVCIDGEMLSDTRYRIENLHHAVVFVSPK